MKSYMTWQIIWNMNMIDKSTQNFTLTSLNTETTVWKLLKLGKTGKGTMAQHL